MGFSGITGGLDVGSIVSQLMQVERQPINRLQSQKAGLQRQIESFNTIDTRLTELRSALNNLGSTGSFGAKSASTSNKDILTASASASAMSGRYSVVVERLATTDTFRSATFESNTSTLQTGSFTLQVGNQRETTITLTESNNTVQKLRDIINEADAGVRASIVSDASGYRLALISQTDGLDGEIQLRDFTNPDQAAQLGLERTVTLQNAALVVNGISISSSNNVVENAIEGLTLNLTGANTATTVNVTVTSDNETVGTSIQKFVDSYNSLMGFLNQQFQNSPGSAGQPLTADPAVRRIQEQLLSSVSFSVTGLNQELVNLRQIGVEMGNDGLLTVDKARLTEVLETRFDQVQALFQEVGRTTDARIQFVANTAATRPGTYSVTVTRAAEQAAVSGASVIGAGLAQDETLTVSLGGSSQQITLTAGQTLSQIVASINTQAGSAGFRARDDGSGRLELYSQAYGSSAQIQVTSSTDESGATGFGTAGRVDTGVDAAGVIGGQAAVGNGQLLRGASGSDMAGLTISTTLTPDDIPPGGLDLGDVILTRGYAAQLAALAGQITDSVNGPLILSKNSLNEQIRGIDSNILDMENLVQVRQRILTDQFNRANEALQNMNSILNSLGAQSSFFGSGRA